MFYIPLSSSETNDNNNDLERLKVLLCAKTYLSLKEVKQVSAEFHRQKDLIDEYPPLQKTKTEQARSMLSINIFNRKDDKSKESKPEVVMSDKARRDLNYKYQKLDDAIKNLHILDPEIKKTYKALNYPTVNWGYVGCAALAIGVLAIRYTPFPVKVALGITCFAACMTSIYYKWFKQQDPIVGYVNIVKLEVYTAQPGLLQGIADDSKGMKNNSAIALNKDPSVFISNLTEFSKIYEKLKPHVDVVTELLFDKNRNNTGKYCTIS